MAMHFEKGSDTPSNLKYFLAVGAIVFAFGASYAYAQSNARAGLANAQTGQVATAPGGQAGGAQGGAANGGCGMGCCGGGSSTPIEGTAKVEGEVQKITVDTSSGGYDPNTINLKAGIPAEITFTQSSGCLSQVVFSDFNINEDLTSGPKTIKLPALESGATYDFSCGMQMVFGKIVVK